MLKMGGISKGDPTRSEWNDRYGQNLGGVQKDRPDAENRRTYLLTLKEGVPTPGGIVTQVNTANMLTTGDDSI